VTPALISTPSVRIDSRSVTTKVVFTTERAGRHQRNALKMAPENLAITMLREPSRADLKAVLGGSEVLISERRGVIDADLLNDAPDLRLILRLGSLSHDIDLEAARARGVVVCWRPQEGVVRVAEHLVMQMVALLRRLPEALAIAREAADGWAPRLTTDEDNFAFNWSERQNLLGLHDRTVGILGFGEIGAELARRLAGWNCSMLYHRRSRMPEDVERELGLTHCSREQLFAVSDVLVCLLPYSAQTRLSIDTVAIAKMKPSALLVSAGSGGVIDELALAQAVRSGQLAGAALDTFAVEPLENDNPLVQAARGGANIMLTPHVAGGSPPDAWEELGRMYQPVLDYLAGNSLSFRLV
jgi:phosphoglycerate dehydrogenase-like enzyme